MTETFSQIIRNGFDTWKSNIGISCINLIWCFISMMLLSISLISLFIPIFMTPPLNAVFTDPESFSNMTPDEVSAMTADVMENLSLSDFIAPGIFVVICLILIILAEFFMTGGIYAMMRDATQNGKCSYGTFLSEGRKNFFRVLVAEIVFLIVTCIIGLIISIIFGVIGFIVGLIIGVLFAASGSSPDSPVFTLLFLIIQIPVSIIATALIFPASFIVYGVVIEKDLSISEALNSSFSFLKHNLKDALKIGLILGCITGLITILNMIPFVSIFVFFILCFVVSPLVSIWSVRLYMDRNNMLSGTEGGCPAGCGSGSAGSCCGDDGLNE
ncbi:MAG: hypothetical protein II940_02105 [Methanosarcinaceae archaeon]|nr:hypothetical protein [Methanosarcinaceae archaeon]